MFRLVGIALFIGLLSSAACADRLILMNGDQLKGKVVKMEKGNMIFASDMIGKLTIDIANIRSFQTDEAIEVHFKDGMVINDTVKQAEAGSIAINDTDNIKAQDFSLQNVAAINPPKVAPSIWHGNLNLGLSSSHGNSFDESGSFSFDVTRDNIETAYQAKSRWNSKALYVFGRSEREVAIDLDSDGIPDRTKKEKFTTEENVTVSSKYDYFYRENMYGFINGSWKKDHIADLDRRLVGGGGLGREWINDGTFLLTTDLGAAIVHEKYVAANRTPPPPTAADSSDEFSGQGGYLFIWKISDRTNFRHNLAYFPSLEEISDYYLTSSAQIRMKINSYWHASFKTLFDYDATPANGSGSSELKYLLSVGWSF